MKNRIAGFLAFALIFGADWVYAQGYTFKVMASSNNPLLKSTNKPLTAGTSLQATDQVIVKEKGYLSLAHKSGGTVQISKAGTYSVAELEKNMLASRSSASSKLLSYVISEVSKGQEDNINQKKYAYMNVTGSVERSTKSLINVFLPQHSKVFEPKINLAWESVVGNKTYVVTLQNEFSEVLKKITTQDTTITIDFNDNALKGSDIVSIIINAKERNLTTPHEAFGLKRVDADEAANFKKMYEAFQKENMTESNPAFAKLAEAMFFEEHEYYMDALRCYNEAVKLAGEDAEPYVIARNQYLMRRNIGTLKEFEEAKANK
ncbi:MAG: hypothetical protein NZ551_11300 [Microscillaceae bacterium]|nr:hypothetical protein [Microscillaceae bacterium]MDW8461782.1 hypothetical protein [Cytophagales bacterium]